jgi:hypothetical protein
MARPYREVRMRATSAIGRALMWAAISTDLAMAQAASLQLRVTDTSGVFLAFANVETGDKQRFVADDRGIIRMPAAAGAVVELSVFRLGFAPRKLTLTLEGDSIVDVRMVPVAVRLAEQVVIARRYDGLVRAGFYDRLDQRQRGAGSGTFLTPEDLAARTPCAFLTSWTALPA